jgi:hypothetical protein
LICVAPFESTFDGVNLRWSNNSRWRSASSRCFFFKVILP